ncbi:hypothetical protein BV22DRAFT_1039956 [Leucogyrophana mollusca]|uniref:Uncharacterized protein n=1 Tax=Leucogyrophana mollusca TaxID=85980 RepID=A0ACB8B4I4_9AGAM|nr:hypothetical protein BV22DRAFT_1039956 [Leucogyrophana mollusca]
MKAKLTKSGVHLGTIGSSWDGHRTRNNCRHFLQSGCWSILDSTSMWHEDMLMVGAGLDVVVPKMGMMMWRSIQRDLYRWIWTYWYGPGKRAVPAKNINVVSTPRCLELTHVPRLGNPLIFGVQRLCYARGPNGS